MIGPDDYHDEPLPLWLDSGEADVLWGFGFIGVGLILILISVLSGCSCNDPACPASAEHVGKYHAGDHP